MLGLCSSCYSAPPWTGFACSSTRWNFTAAPRLRPCLRPHFALSSSSGSEDSRNASMEAALPEVEVLDPMEVLLDDRFQDEEDAVLPSSREEGQYLLQVLDACLDAKDMKLVAKTYAFLRRKGLVSNFGRYKSREFEDGERLITPEAIKEMAGVEASKLSPKKWGVSGVSAAVLISFIVFNSVLVDNGVDIRGPLIFILGLALVDAIYLGGAGFSQVQSFWLPNRRRIMVHEAGHVVVAYLLGCPVRGVVLDAFQAMKLGIQGLAGTQFWDETLEDELKLGRLTAATIDRYTMVLFAGIAAEALVYGEAEGGENDENLYLSMTSMLSPPWSLAKKGNQARWAVLQSFKLLKQHRHVHSAVTKALEKGATMSMIVKSIEDAMSEAETCNS